MSTSRVPRRNSSLAVSMIVSHLVREEISCSPRVAREETLSREIRYQIQKRREAQGIKRRHPPGGRAESCAARSCYPVKFGGCSCQRYTFSRQSARPSVNLAVPSPHRRQLTWE